MKIVTDLQDDDHERIQEMMRKTGTKTPTQLVMLALENLAMDIDAIENKGKPSIFYPDTKKLRFKDLPELQHAEEATRAMGNFTAQLIEKSKNPPNNGRE